VCTEGKKGKQDSGGKATHFVSDVTAKMLFPAPVLGG